MNDVAARFDATLPDGLTPELMRAAIAYLHDRGVYCCVEAFDEWGGIFTDVDALLALLADEDALQAFKNGVTRAQWQAFAAAGCPEVIRCRASTASGDPCSLLAIEDSGRYRPAQRFARAAELGFRCHVHQRTLEAAYSHKKG